MADSNPIIIGGGISSGAPFTLGHLVYISNATPPQLSSYEPVRALDGLVSYTGVPSSTGVYPAVVGAAETFRIVGGLICEATGQADSVKIGRAATVVTPDGISIGRGVIGSTQPRGVVIGATSNGSGGASFVGGYNSGSGSGAPVGGVFIGEQAQASGNAGGANVVVIGDGALIVLGGAGGGGGVAIGFASSIAHPSGVAIGYGATATFSSALGQNTVTIGNLATSNKAGTTVVGGAANTTQTGATVIGSGASATAAAAQIRSVVIGQSSSSTGSDAIVIGGGSALTTNSIAIGAAAVDLGAGVAQIGANGTQITTLLVGMGDTIAGAPGLTFRLTNGSGADNAVGNFVLQAARSTGAAAPSMFDFQTTLAHGSDAVLQTLRSSLQLTALGNVMFAGQKATGVGSAYETTSNIVVLYGDLNGAAPNRTAQLKLVNIANTSTVALFRMDGTPAAPTAIANADTLGQVFAGGYDGTTFSNAGPGITMTATEAWTNAAHGCSIEFQTVANTTLTRNIVARIFHDGSFFWLPPAAGTVIWRWNGNISSAVGVQLATIANLPAAATAGNPNKWMIVDDNGTPGYIPVWH